MSQGYKEPDYSGINNISVHSSGYNALSPLLNIDPSFLIQDNGAEYVFAEDSKKRRGWGERMFSSVGSLYMAGIFSGGVWGVMEGLRNPEGKTFKLRLNSLLNGCTRRGPFLGNNLAVVALMYGCINAAIETGRGVEDEYNSYASAITAGALFKSTAGPRAILIGAGLGGSLALAYSASNKLWNNRGQTWSSSQPSWA
ncbi:mitochondrial import inner membrane translocase subunit Tim23 isoform X1 [Hydra vulgaris]|uniref:Mitochondrial import inner membrane translocase subunit Tim23 n=1 Tax=Hydra vulgaris TaxID=6087 RepID=T2MJ05_HYDVU|nr:mitochondrial import inner membrane translocase subunit Tim23 [Hydra vulgaris]